MRRLSVGILGLVAAAAFCGDAQALAKEQVPGLQVALYRHGYYKGPIDGIAGPMTNRAVRQFQKAAKLEVDGVAGKQTRKALGRLGRPLFGARTLHRGTIGFDVSVLQFLLAKHGFAPPRLNSNFGPQTEALVQRFQRKAGLAPDGVVGRKTRTALLRGVFLPQRPRAQRTDVKSSIAHWAAHYGVSERLARALAWQESGFQNDVRSSAGAFGVMQVTPATWEFVELFVIGERIARTVDGNVRVGIAYLDHLLRQFRGNVRRAIGAYYQGPASVRKDGLYRETKRVVANVLALRGRV